MSLLDEIVARLGAMPEPEREALVESAMQATANLPWVPSTGPQTEAYLSTADVLLYGGAGGGGKSDALLGLAFTQHRRSLLMRRAYTNLSALIDRAIEINGGRDGFNGKPPPRLTTRDGRIIDFGAANNLGDEQGWQGQPHDLLGLDEATQFLEVQVRFLMGWVRTTAEGQRTRVVLATNPPLSAEGDWIIGMFRPWLDLTHPNPAKAGELRWFITAPDGSDLEVEGPRPVTIGGHDYIPKSRTFIPAKLADNPFLVNSGYQAQLDALPEPLRSAVRDGNFMAARRDQDRQLIPSQWVREAMARWQPHPPAGVPMCAMGVDVAQGGADKTVIACRHDGWFAPLIGFRGEQTPDGPSVAALVIQHRRDAALVVIDMGGGFGGSALDHLRANLDTDRTRPSVVVAYKGAEGSTRRTADQQIKFTNRRTEAYWKFREALDPSQPQGSPIMLPDDPELMADLTAPIFDVGPRGMAAETKKDVTDKLGRSPDKGDAVVMAWWAGARAETHASIWLDGRRSTPRVVLGHEAARRRAA